MIKATMYDVDDTLFDSTLGSANNLHYALIQFPNLDSNAVPDLSIVIDNAVSPTWKEWVASCMPGINVDDFREFYMGLVDQLPYNSYPLVNGAQPTLDFTRKLGPQGIVTSRERDMFLKRAATAGLNLGQFDFTHTYADVEEPKPNPLAFKPGIEIITSQGVPKEEIIYVGDRMVDYSAARDAGIGFVGVLTGPERLVIQNLAGRNGTGVINSVADLPAYIQKQNNNNGGQ